MKFKRSFLKQIWLTITLLVVTAGVFITQVSFATPKPQPEPVATTQPPSVEDFPCYFQTQQGTTFDLSKLCGASPPTAAEPVARPDSSKPRDYDYRKIKDFDDSLYGRNDEVYGQQ